MNTCYFIFDEKKNFNSVLDSYEFCKSKNLDNIEEHLDFAEIIYNYLLSISEIVLKTKKNYQRDTDKYGYLKRLQIPAGRYKVDQKEMRIFL